MHDDSVIDRVLDRWGGEPVLLDVGASGAPPEAWLPLAGRSHYIALDPDEREMAHAAGEGPFRHKTVVHEAVTADAGTTAVHFYLTRSPFCSSTLPPNPPVVANFFNADRFDVVSETTAHAVTLDEVLGRLGLHRIDWLKLDTQGTDRRIYASLSGPVRRKLLAVDLEPGLRGAYAGEDLFGDVHAAMLRDGFWLSTMDVKGMVRMRQATLDQLRTRYPDIDDGVVRRAVRRTPGWTELRYLRSIESLQSVGAAQRDYALLWVIATIDGQHGFALDLVAASERAFGADATTTVMRDDSVARIRAARKLHQRSLGLRKRALGFIRRFAQHGRPTSPAPTRSAASTPKPINPGLPIGGGGAV